MRSPPRDPRAVSSPPRSYRTSRANALHRAAATPWGRPCGRRQRNLEVPRHLLVSGGSKDPPLRVLTCSPAHLPTCSPAHLPLRAARSALYERIRHVCGGGDPDALHLHVFLDHLLAALAAEAGAL